MRPVTTFSFPASESTRAQTPAKGLAASLLLSGVFVLLTTPDRSLSALVLTGFGLSTAGWLLALLLSWTTRSLLAFMALGLLCRGLWLFVPPLLSNDWARYLWDGFLLQSRLNPFEALPSSMPDFAPELLGQMNSPDYYSVYPPVAQAIFGLAARFGSPEDPTAAILVLRLVFLVADLLAVALLYALLPPTQKAKVLIYALAPLAMLETAGNLHLEGVAIAFSLAAVYFLHRWQRAVPDFGRKGPWATRDGWLLPTSVALALAICTKLHPVLLLLPLPFWIGWKRSFVLGTLTTVWVILAFLPFRSPVVAANLLDSIDLYFRNFEFNGGIYNLGRWISLEATGYNRITLVGPLLGALAATGIVWLSLYRKPSHAQAFLATLFWIAFIHQAFATTVHPWYLLPLLAWSAFTPSRIGLVWAALVPLSYVAYASPDFHLPTWVLIAEYGVVFAVFLLELVRPGWTGRA